MSRDIPNWKNPADYPDPKDTTLLQWAWEFFRRNMDYRRDYDDYTKASRSVKVHGIDEKGVITRLCCCDPPAIPGETRSQYFKRNSGVKCKMTPPLSMISEKYRLSDILIWLPNPRKYELPDILFFDVAVKMRTFEVSERISRRALIAQGNSPPDDYESGLIPSGENEVAVMINLDIPLNEQFHNIKKLLDTWGLGKNFKLRNHLSKLTSYLRVSDAISESISMPDIAECLSNQSGGEDIGVDTIENHAKAAKRYIEKDYWKLSVKH